MKATTYVSLGLAALLMGSTAASAKTLVYCSEGSPENFQPAINTTGTSFDAARPVYNRLTEFKRGTTEVTPGLAESWDIADGGKTITFHLRKGVKFHSLKDFKPTRDFNADDVLFSFNRQWKPDNPYSKVSGGKYDYFNDMDMPALLDTIEKKDDYTVVFHLKTPNVAILANLAMDFASIASAEYADFLLKKGTPEQFDQAPVGTGPFSFVAYQKDAVIRFKKNPDYFGEKALVDDLIYAITPDATARYAKLKAGECHINAYPRPADLEEMEKDPTLKVINASGSQHRLLGVQQHQAAVRQEGGAPGVLAMAIDRDAIIRDVYLGAGEKAKTLIPRTMWSYDDKIPRLSLRSSESQGDARGRGRQDAARHRPLVSAGAAPLQSERQADRRDDAGRSRQGRRQRQARDLRMGRVPQARPGRRGHDRAIGLDRRQRRSRQFLLPRQLRRTAKPANNNIPKWCNAEFDDLLVKARVDPRSGRTRQALSAHAGDRARGGAGIAGRPFDVFEAMRANVTGYKQSPLGTHEFEGVDLQ